MVIIDERIGIPVDQLLYRLILEKAGWETRVKVREALQFKQLIGSELKFQDLEVVQDLGLRTCPRMGMMRAFCCCCRTQLMATCAGL